MNAEQLKAHYDIVATIGETVHLKKQGGEYKGLCPFHNDKNTPSLSVSADKQIFNCFGCGATGDVIEFVRRRDSHATAGDAIKAMTARIGGGASVLAKLAKSAPRAAESTPTAPPPDVSADVEKWRTAYAGSAGAGYMERRGISQATAERYGLGWNAHEKRVVIPYDGGYTARAVDDAHSPKYRKATGWGGLRVFPDNSDELLTATQGAPFYLRPVFVVEGEIDALSIIETGAAPAIAVGGAANVPKLAQHLRALQERAGHDLEPLVLIPDNDEPGRAAMGKLAAELKRAGIGYVLYGDDGTDNPVFDILGSKYKDVNEALTADRADLTQRITAAYRAAESEIRRKARAAIEAYHATAASGYLSRQSFESYLDTRKDGAISTGWRELDTILSGGLYEGIYTLLGTTGFGKTAFCLQMAEQISKQGRDVLYITLEITNEELTARGISRTSFCLAHNPNSPKVFYENRAFNKMQVLQSREKTYFKDELDALNNAFDTYFDQKTGRARNVYFIYDPRATAGRIEEYVEKHLAAGGHWPVVIIDYLQLLRPEDDSGRRTDKQNTDTTVTALCEIYEKYHIPIIAISAVNRGAANSSIDVTSGRESSTIEYSSSVVMALQERGLFMHERRRGDDEAASFKRTKHAAYGDDYTLGEIVIHKNRHGVRSYKTSDEPPKARNVVNVDFWGAYGHYSVADDPN